MLVFSTAKLKLLVCLLYFSFESTQSAQSQDWDSLQDDWYKRAELALQNGKEDLAREALERRQTNQVVLTSRWAI